MRSGTKSLVAGLFCAFALSACATAPAAPCRTRSACSTSSAPVSIVTLSIVGTNDLHGGVTARDGRGGLALLGGYVRNLRAARDKDGGAVVLLDGGDMFQGTMESNLSEGAPVVAAYNALGYTAAAVGNHEFDFGPVGPAGHASQPGRRSQRRAEGARRRGAVPVSRGEPDRSCTQCAGGLAERPADGDRERAAACASASSG